MAAVYPRALEYDAAMSMSKVRRPLHTIWAMFPSIVLTIVVAEAGLWLARYLIDGAELRPDADVVGNYLQTLGTIYAVLLAFVVFVVWSQFNDARGCVEREANEVLDLYRTAKGFPDGPRKGVHQLLRTYVETVLTREWSAMAHDDDKVLAQNSAVLDAVWDILQGFEPESECHSTLYAEVLARFNDLSDTRTNRLSSARLRIPLALRILLHTGAFLTVGSMYLFAVDSVAVHAVITGAMAGAIAHVLYLIRDLDGCFEGDWQVPREPFERVRTYMDEYQGRIKAAAEA